MRLSGSQLSEMAFSELEQFEQQNQPFILSQTLKWTKYIFAQLAFPMILSYASTQGIY